MSEASLQRIAGYSESLEFTHLIEQLDAQLLQELPELLARLRIPH